MNGLISYIFGLLILTIFYGMIAESNANSKKKYLKSSLGRILNPYGISQDEINLYIDDLSAEDLNRKYNYVRRRRKRFTQDEIETIAVDIRKKYLAHTESQTIEKQNLEFNKTVQAFKTFNKKQQAYFVEMAKLDPSINDDQVRILEFIFLGDENKNDNQTDYIIGGLNILSVKKKK